MCVETISLKNCFSKPKSDIDNSFALKKKLNNIFIPDEFVLLSLDVNSLLTNVSEKLVLNSINCKYSLILNKCKILFDTVRVLIKFLFNNNYFQFNNVFYKQTYGKPVGSLISPLFADIVMEDLETDCFEILFKNHKCIPKFYYRCEDDSCVCLNKNFI